MKILLAHKFHKYTGGADVFYLEVGRVLQEHGHEVAYFSTYDNETIDNDYLEYFVKAPDFRSGSMLQKIKAFTKIPYNFEAKRKFEKLLIDFKPDIVHVFGIVTQISPSILDAVGSKNIPLVISLNDYKHICPNYKLFHHGRLCEDCKGGKFYNTIINKCAHDSRLFSLASAIESYTHSWLNIYRKNVDLFLFASDFMAHKTEEFWGESFTWSKLMNPFNIPDIEPVSSREDYGLYFGRLIEEKGVHLIIEALKEMKHLPFKIIGDGPQTEQLKEMVANNQLENVEFLGSLWEDRLNDVLYKARYVIIPSVWHENFPYVILQAFAAGVPVIGSDRGGIPELLNQDRGIVFEPSYKDSLRIAIEKLSTNVNFGNIMGNNGRKYVVSQFNDEVFYKSIMNNYNKLIK